MSADHPRSEVSQPTTHETPELLSVSFTAVIRKLRAEFYSASELRAYKLPAEAWLETWAVGESGVGRIGEGWWESGGERGVVLAGEGSTSPITADPEQLHRSEQP